MIDAQTAQKIANETTEILSSRPQALANARARVKIKRPLFAYIALEKLQELARLAGGDPSSINEDNRDEYLQEINERIAQQITQRPI